MSQTDFDSLLSPRGSPMPVLTQLKATFSQSVSETRHSMI
jgi:hypothetical protein